MHNIPRVFWDVLLIGIFVIIGLGLVSAIVDRADAIDYKASVIDEIENSNFNDEVIASCINQANDAGYTLNVNKIVTDVDENKQVAEVILDYKFSIGILNINNQHSTRGFAR